MLKQNINKTRFRFIFTPTQLQAHQIWNTVFLENFTPPYRPDADNLDVTRVGRIIRIRSLWKTTFVTDRIVEAFSLILLDNEIENRVLGICSK